MFAIVWIGAAALRPASTFHLAPILITLGSVVLAATDERRKPAWTAAVALAGGSSLVATGVLAAAGWLDGPSLLPFGGAATEAVVFTAASALVGFLTGGGALATTST